MTFDVLKSALLDLLGPRLVTSADVRRQHGSDDSYHPPAPPDAVVYPETIDEVVQIVRLCADSRTPIIPFGTGTSLEGHIGAVEGGISLDMSRMDNILAVRVDDLDATVQAGVTRKQLNDQLRPSGLFFPVDPGADASLGGMAATRASGTTTVRYGTMRDNVVNLTVVLADGRVIRTSSRARKSSAGYDLTRLFVGSEGTLGVICELTLRLFGVPEAISAAVCSFESIEDAVNCVTRVIQLGLSVARCELLDEVMMDAINRHSGLDYRVAPTVFFEFHGSEAGVVEQAETVEAIASEFGGSGFRWAVRQEERTRLWEARHNALYASLALRPGAKTVITDVCVPLSSLAECISLTKKDLVSSRLIAPIVGHVGDGNFHVAFLIDPDDPEEIAEAKEINERMVMRALQMEGTCTGEHGIGRGKIEPLMTEHGEGVDVMRGVKSALDPLGIMNPGKIFSGRAVQG